MAIINVLILIFFTSTFSVYAEKMEDCSKMSREERCSSIFEKKDDCRKPEYKPMLMGCLVTCGSCESFSCSNPQPDSVLNCTSLQDQCNSTNWSTFMKDRCSSTCGSCDQKNGNLCDDSDTTAVCSGMAAFCNSVDYYEQMTRQCASTCNRCSSKANGTTGGVCVDTATDCHLHMERCDDAHYSGLMGKICARSCNKCAHTCVDQIKQSVEKPS